MVSVTKFGTAVYYAGESLKRDKDVGMEAVSRSRVL